MKRGDNMEFSLVLVKGSSITIKDSEDKKGEEKAKPYLVEVKKKTEEDISPPFLMFEEVGY